MSAMLAIFASRFLPQAENERTSIATKAPCEPRDLRLQCHDDLAVRAALPTSRRPGGGGAWRFPRNRRYQCLAIIRKSAAAGAAWQASEQPTARLSGGRQARTGRSC